MYYDINGEFSDFLFNLVYETRRKCVIYIHSFFLIPATTANDIRLRRISIPDFIHYSLCPIFILQKEPVFLFLVLTAKTRELFFPFQCSVLNKGTTGTISITYLV